MQGDPNYRTETPPATHKDLATSSSAFAVHGGGAPRVKSPFTRPEALRKFNPRYLNLQCTKSFSLQNVLYNIRWHAGFCGGWGIWGEGVEHASE